MRRKTVGAHFPRGRSVIYFSYENFENCRNFWRCVNFWIFIWHFVYSKNKFFKIFSKISTSSILARVVQFKQSNFYRFSFFGPSEVFVLSQDDKCRIPIGVTAANLQAPLVMHMDFKVRLSDHDFVVANKHKLILSVCLCRLRSKARRLWRSESCYILR